MSFEIAPLAAFAFATSITPGPNNLMLMASGARFGVQRTVPHWLGVSLGFGALAIGCGFGLAGALAAWPELERVMKIASAAFILWIAWRIATSGASTEKSGAARPMTFLEAAAFQWINPKAVAMALAAVTVYTPSDAPIYVLATAAVFVTVNFACVGAWVAAGRRIYQWLKNPSQRRAFNYVMAALLVVAMWPILA